MTDRELLELAAKAAEVTDVGEWFDSDEGPYFVVGSKVWDPITDDGDALRLAVRLELEVSLGNFGAIVYLKSGKVEEIGEDGCDAMSLFRRAIVRAAAEIGRRM